MEPRDKDLLDLLPWYLNGTLDDPSRRRVEILLCSSRAVQAEVVWLRSIQDQIRSEKAMEILPAPDAGLDRLMSMIDGERSEKCVNLSKIGRPPARWPTVPLAITVALLAPIVAHLLLQDWAGTDKNKTFAGMSSAPQHGAFLQITFKSNATEPQIRATLALIEGSIVSGPGVIGLYTVRVSTSQAQSALVKLEHQKDVVDSASLLQE